MINILLCILRGIALLGALLLVACGDASELATETPLDDSGGNFIQIGQLTWTPNDASELQAFSHITTWPLDTRVRAGSANDPAEAVDLRFYHQPTSIAPASYELLSYTPYIKMLNAAYLSWQTPQGRCVAEEGSVEVTKYDAVGGQVSGTFSITSAYAEDPEDEDGYCDGFPADGTPVTGSFSVKRGMDNSYGNDGSGTDHMTVERTPKNGSSPPTDTASFPSISGYTETAATPHLPLIVAYPRADGGAEIVLETELAFAHGRRRELRIVIEEPLHSGVAASMYEVYDTFSGQQLYCPSSNGAAYFFTGGTGEILFGEFHGNVDTSVSLFPCPASYVVKFTVRKEATAP